jgi:hypothetical protein
MNTPLGLAIWFVLSVLAVSFVVIGDVKEARQRREGIRDPIHTDGKMWWFWDETWSDEIGPYRTWLGAWIALQRYVARLK